jgi:fatty acid desaturase
MIDDQHISSLSRDEVHALKRQLPPHAFDPTPARLITLTVHGLIVFTTFFISGHARSAFVAFFSAIIAGHSLACIGFLAHELTHGCIVKNRTVTWVAERLFWSLALVSPTMWRRAHNQTHHPHLNTPLDCDRRFQLAEKSPLRRWYVLLLYPHAELVPWNPFVWLYMNVYFLRNTLAALVPSSIIAPFVPSLPLAAKGDMLRVYLDLAIILSIQGLLALVGSFSIPRFLFVAGVSQVAAAVVAMGYIFTNHFLNPICENADPLTSTTSVVVPKWLDSIHSHYSYHTEHHLFPTLNSAYYPVLSKLLEQKYPQRYQRIPIGEAWRHLWRQAAFAPGPKPARRGEPGG